MKFSLVEFSIARPKWVLFDRDSKAMARWQVRGLPNTFVVDRQGRLALRAVGGREFDDPAIVAQLRELLKQGSVT